MIFIIRALILTQTNVQLILQANNSNSSDSVMLLMAIGYVVYSFGTVFVACETSQNGCDAVNAFDMEIIQIDWLVYPIEMKKMLPIIIIMV